MDTSREKFEEGKWTAEAASAFGAKVEDRGRRMRAREPGYMIKDATATQKKWDAITGKTGTLGLKSYPGTDRLLPAVDATKNINSHVGGMIEKIGQGIKSSVVTGINNPAWHKQMNLFSMLFQTLDD